MVIVGEATPGPWVPLNDTEATLGRGAGARAALAVNAGTVARASAAAAASTAAAGRHRAGLRPPGRLMVMAGSFRSGPVLVWVQPVGGWLMPEPTMGIAAQ